MTLDAAPPGERVERGAAGQRSGERRERHRRRAARRPQDDDRDGGQRRSAGDADDVRRDERVARDQLEDGASQAERGTGEQGGQRAREPEVEDDEAGGRVARAGEGREHVERRDGELPERDAHRQREQRRGRDGEQHAQDPDVEPQRCRPAPHGHPPPAHSATILRRRTSQMKNGAPSSAVTIPTSSSAGRATTRPSTSAARSRTAPRTMLYGTIQR